MVIRRRKLENDDNLDKDKFQEIAIIQGGALAQILAQENCLQSLCE